eukprot:TRINITY_DN11009_c0_g1_i1.p1 TRINITY_DN11009_c0_g1~~TRINITY_DN11009_c0_g1_i1.p1  ORF type:complete len:174 (+),score=45.25 TRINITY_DN11009_c0_g1_i1:59-523(+)
MGRFGRIPHWDRVLLRVVEGDLSSSLAAAVVDKLLKILRSNDGKGGVADSQLLDIVQDVISEAMQESVICRAATRIRERINSDAVTESGEESAQIFLELLSLAAFPASLKTRLLFAVLTKVAHHFSEWQADRGGPHTDQPLFVLPQDTPPQARL